MGDTAYTAKESFDEAMGSYQDVVQTAARLQQEFVKGLREMFNVAGVPAWQQKAQAAADNIVNVAQINTEDSLQAIERNFKAGMGLWQKAFEFRPDQPQGEVQQNIRDETLGFWQAMMGLLRTNTETLIGMNKRIVNTWMELGNLADTAKNGHGG
jgi:hypothetical protein